MITSSAAYATISMTTSSIILHDDMLSIAIVLNTSGWGLQYVITQSPPVSVALHTANSNNMHGVTCQILHYCQCTHRVHTQSLQLRRGLLGLHIYNLHIIRPYVAGAMSLFPQRGSFASIADGWRCGWCVEYNHACMDCMVCVRIFISSLLGCQLASIRAIMIARI